MINIQMEFNNDQLKNVTLAEDNYLKICSCCYLIFFYGFLFDIYIYVLNTIHVCKTFTYIYISVCIYIYPSLMTRQ